MPDSPLEQTPALKVNVLGCVERLQSFPAIEPTRDPLQRRPEIRPTSLRIVQSTSFTTLLSLTASEATKPTPELLGDCESTDSGISSPKHAVALALQATKFLGFCSYSDDDSTAYGTHRIPKDSLILSLKISADASTSVLLDLSRPLPQALHIANFRIHLQYLSRLRSLHNPSYQISQLDPRLTYLLECTQPPSPQ